MTLIRKDLVANYASTRLRNLIIMIIKIIKISVIITSLADR